MNHDQAKMKVVWMITERGEKSYWTRIGVGFENRDGSVTMQLDAVPLSGAKLQLRDYTPRDTEDDGRPRERTERTERNGHAKHGRARDEVPL